MNYSIFHETMADMTYRQIEQAAEDDVLVLFPIAVIEEHGPHLCLGTDIYLSYSICKNIKHELEKKNISSIIVPPFYWGINHLTSGFTGSFNTKESTMKNALLDIILGL